jgi:hypothetical protein
MILSTYQAPVQLSAPRANFVGLDFPSLDSIAGKQNCLPGNF